MIQRAVEEIYDSVSKRGMTLETDENKIKQKLTEIKNTLTANETQLEQCRQTIREANDSLTLLEAERKDLETDLLKSTEESRKLKQSIDEFHAMMSNLMSRHNFVVEKRNLFSPSLFDILAIKA